MNIEDIKFDQEDIDKFTSRITNKSGVKGYKIKINGEFIRLNSGKSVWSKNNHAKSALKNHYWGFPGDLAIKYRKYCEENGYIGSKNRNKLWNHFLDFLQEKGILEFVELK